jgi:hypothetical protein
MSCLAIPVQSGNLQAGQWISPSQASAEWTVKVRFTPLAPSLIWSEHVHPCPVRSFPPGLLRGSVARPGPERLPGRNAADVTECAAFGDQQRRNQALTEPVRVTPRLGTAQPHTAPEGNAHCCSGLAERAAPRVYEHVTGCVAATSNTAAMNYRALSCRPAPPDPKARPSRQSR